jgi:hypothetical protein
MQPHFITVKEDLYQVVRIIPEHTGIDTEVFRVSSNSTNVFRKDGYYWFVRIVEEAEVIEDSLEN